MQKESSQCKTVGLIARISWSLLHRGDRASTCEKVAIKDGVSKSLETSFLPMALFFFFEQHQYSHPQCKWCLKVLIQTYIDVASVRLTSTQGSGEKLLWPDRRSSAHSWKVWSMFVCLCVSERTCEWKLSVLCSFLGRIVGQKLQVERGSGRRFGYKLYKSGKKNRKAKIKKKAAIFFFFFEQPEPSGSVWLVLHVLNLGLLGLRKWLYHLEGKGATDSEKMHRAEADLYIHFKCIH